MLKRSEFCCLIMACITIPSWADVDISPNASPTCDAGVVGTSSGSVCLRANYELASYNCASGTYLPADAEGCTACPSGYTCPGGTFIHNATMNQGITMNYNGPKTSSPVIGGCGVIDSTQNAIFRINQYTCNSGYYLPADGIACVLCVSGYTCPGGTFTYNATMNQGITMNYNGPKTTSPVINGCGQIDSTQHALFRINQYTCNSGQFLPADGLGCVACPANATCTGGTYEYNATSPQGVEINFPITQNQSKMCSSSYGNKIAILKPNQYTCAAGQYLPADATECVQCPADSYCIGGTYTFNEITAQGITACDAGAHSPAGSSSASQCIAGYTCTSGQYLPKNTTTCTACPTGYTCAGGVFDMDSIDQGLVANNISITWKNEDGTTLTTNTCTYDQPITIPANPTKTGYTFNGWTVVNK